MEKPVTDVDDTTAAAKAAKAAEEAKGEETIIEDEPTSEEVVDESPDTDGEDEPGGEEGAKAKVEDGDVTPEKQDQEPEDEEGELKPWMKKRLRREQGKAGRESERAEKAEKELAELKRKDAEAAATEEPPKREDYEDYEDYVADKAAHSAKQAVREEMRVDDERKAEANRQVALDKSFKAHEDRVEAYKDQVGDFDDVAYGDHILPIMRSAPHLAQLVVESDQGPQIAYHLGSNPEAAEKIAAMPMHLAAKEIGKIEARLEKAPKLKNKSKAPEPINPVKGKDAGAVERSAEDMPMDEYARARKAGKI